MTLISVIYDHGYPLIVSDRAISQQGTSSSIILPTTNEKTIRPTPVTGFNVKTIIIQDVLCIGFSGIVSIIESLVSDIQDYFLHRAVTIEALNELLIMLEYANECSVAYVFADNKHDQFVIQRTGNWLLDQTRSNLDILSCGSGAREWNTQLLTSSSYLDDSEINPLFCRQRALQACISFMAKERITARNLLDGWGGGFDIVYYENGKFQRLNDVAYAFYVIDISNNDTILTPISIIHQRYTNGKVIIRHFETKGTQIYSISEFNDKLPYIEDDSNCLSKEVISCVHLFNGKNHTSDLAVLFWDNDVNAEPTLFTTRINDTFGIKFRKIYYDKLNEAVKSSMS